MRDNYDPPAGPAPWERMRGPQPPMLPTQPISPRRHAWSFEEDRYGERPNQFEEAATAARAAGLKRMSKLTWRAAQLSALAAVGFAALFARSAPPSHTVAAASTPSPKPSPSPSPSPTRAHHKRRHHHKATPSPAPTLAAPTTPPAPPPPAPSPTPVTTSGGSGG